MTSQTDITIYMTLTSTLTAPSSSSTNENVYVTTRTLAQVLTMTLSSTLSTVSTANPSSTLKQILFEPSTSTSSIIGATSSAGSSSSASFQGIEISQPTTSSSLSNSAKLGLALGIPLGITFLFALVVLVWHLVRKRATNTVPFAEHPVSNSSSNSSNSDDLEKAPKHKPTPLDLNQNRKESMVRDGSSDNPEPTPNLRTLIKSRFSIYNKSQDYVISPLFLKRFKLHPTVVCKPYLKCRPDELSIAVGEKVILVKEFLDGWCKVRKDGMEGVVPKVCLK